MKLLSVIALTSLLLFGLGCSNDRVTAPTGSESSEYDILGNDAPADVTAAVAELGEISVTVPERVAADDPALAEQVDLDAAERILSASSLDDPARVQFRRILTHLHRQQRALRACMATNDDPQLRRLAFGANQAIQRGLRALRADEPRVALRAFRVANRVLNLANSRCAG